MFNLIFFINVIITALFMIYKIAVLPGILTHSVTSNLILSLNSL